MHSKLRGFHKYVPSKKIWDFTECDGLHMLYQSIKGVQNENSTLLVVSRESNEKCFILMCSESSKLHDVKKWQSTR